jgi:hypothetical protein
MKRVLNMSPATGIVTFADDDVTTIMVHQAAFDPEDPMLGSVLFFFSPYDDRQLGIEDVTVDVPGRFEAKLLNGGSVVVRQSEPEDAMSVGLAPFPLPIEAMRQILIGGGMSADLYAMTDPNGDVHTVLLFTDFARWVRYGGAWIALADLSLLDQYSAWRTNANGLTLYDAADQSGQMVHISSMPTPELSPPSQTVISLPEEGRVPSTTNPLGSTNPTEVGSTPALEPVPTTASGVPLISGPDDIDAAIDAADEDPDMRWYVERRIAALGIERELPWQ